MAMLDGGLSAEEAIACSCLESDFQIDRYGKLVEETYSLDRQVNQSESYSLDLYSLNCNCR